MIQSRPLYALSCGSHIGNLLRPDRRDRIPRVIRAWVIVHIIRDVHSTHTQRAQRVNQRRRGGRRPVVCQHGLLRGRRRRGDDQVRCAEGGVGGLVGDNQVC